MNPSQYISSPSVADVRKAVMRNTAAFTRSLSVGLLVTSVPLFAAETETSTLPWVSLFNGRDLTGWKTVALTDPAPAVVEDGVMVLRQRIKTSEHTFVTSELDYEDFILELDLKDDPGFNSGILLRSIEAPANAKVRLNGYQVKIDNTPRAWTGGIFDDFGDSWTWLHDLAENERGRAAFELGEWQQFRIECIGASLKVWVNGVPTSHLVDEKYRKGRIAFKIHSLANNPKAAQTAIRLKNFRIITDQPERHTQPMNLPPRRAPSGPGKFDKEKPTTNNDPQPPPAPEKVPQPATTSAPPSPAPGSRIEAETSPSTNCCQTKDRRAKLLIAILKDHQTWKYKSPAQSPPIASPPSCCC
jgi:hypothetical protein